MNVFGIPGRSDAYAPASISCTKWKVDGIGFYQPCTISLAILPECLGWDWMCLGFIGPPMEIFKRFIAFLGDSGSLYYQPKQGTIKGKSFKKLP